MELKSTSKRRFFLNIDKAVEEQLNKNEYSNKEESKSEYTSIKAKMGPSLYSSFAMEDSLNIIDDKKVPTFSKLVKEHMLKKGMTSKDIYKNSLINRKLFSALNVNDYYIPSKETAVMYCFALKLDLEEAMELLNSAGYTLYKYSNFDIIITYFINHKLYNIDRLNDTLYFYTKRCIGYR